MPLNNKKTGGKMTDCLTLNIDKGKALFPEGLEFKPWDTFPLKRGYINLRNTIRVGLHAVYFDNNKKCQYIQHLKEGESYCLRPPDDSSVEENLIKEIFTEFNIPPNIVRNTKKEINANNYCKRKYDEIFEREYISDGKISCFRKYIKHGINGYICDKEYNLNDYSYVIVLERNNSKTTIKRIFLNNPNPIVLKDILKGLKLSQPKKKKKNVT